MSSLQTARPRGVIRSVVGTAVLGAVSLAGGGLVSENALTDGLVLETRLDGVAVVRDGATGVLILTIPSDSERGGPTRPEAVGQIPGWPAAALGPVDASPAVVDLDGDGALEVAFSSRTWVYAVRADGSSLPGWPIGGGFSRRSVAVGRAYGISSPLVVSGTVSRSLLLGVLEAWDFRGVPPPGWPAVLATNVFVAPPTLADLDSDGALDVLGSPEGYQYAFRGDGTALPGWPALMDADYSFSIKPAAVGDVDGDGRPEVFVGAQDGKLYGWDAAGNRLPGFPVVFPGRINGGAVLADFDNDGALEIGTTTDLGQIALLEADGTMLPGWPQQTCCITNAGLAVGDLDADGWLELATATINSTPDFAARVYVWNHDGSVRPGWPQVVPLFGFSATPTFADVDGDGLADVVVGGAEASFSPSGRIYAWRADGSLIYGFPFFLPGGQAIMSSQVSAADLDQDGMLDLLVGSSLGLSSGPGQVHVVPTGVPYDPTTLEWPTQGHDYQRTSRYVPPPRKVVVEVVPPSLSLDHPPGIVTVRVTLPAGLTELSPEFLLTGVQGHPVSLAGRSVGPGPGGRLRLVQFDGQDLASLIRSTLDPVPAQVRLDFSAETEAALHGFTSVTTR